MAILGVIGLIWAILLVFYCSKGESKIVEVLLAFPGHLLITIVYYAICNVCYSILFISDCVNEHKELLDNISEGRKFFENKNIKYN